MQPIITDPEHRYSLPPDVLASLSDRDDVAALNEVWVLAGSAAREEADEVWVRQAGAEIRRALRSVTRPRAVIRPLRRMPVRFALSMAACLAMLVAIGIALQPTSKSISVPYGAELKHVLPDGSVLRLNSGSKIVYGKDFGQEARELRLVRGEGHFEVTESTVPFRVQTFKGDVEVLGTTFNVRAWPSDGFADVAVSTGRVKVTSREATGEALVLAAGQSARIGDQSPVRLEESYAENAPSWQDGSFKFQDHPLGVIVREVERRYDVTVGISPQEFTRERLGILEEDPEGAEEILRIVCELKPCRLSVVPDGFEIVAVTAD